MMHPSRYEPLKLLDQMNHLFGQSLRGNYESDASRIDTSEWVPAVDIKEEKSRFVIYADLPGIDKGNISIGMDQHILTIQGERHAEEKEKMKDYTRQERVRGTFYRRFSLPDTADGEKIQANIKNGVLEVIIPKKTTAQPRKIEIKVED